MIRRDREREIAVENDYYGYKVNLVLNWFEELKRLVPTEN